MLISQFKLDAFAIQAAEPVNINVGAGCTLGISDP